MGGCDISFTVKRLKLSRGCWSLMPWHRFRQVRLQWISSVEKFRSLLLLRIEIISKHTSNKFKKNWLHEISKSPHRNDSTVGKNWFFLVLFLFNVQYKPDFLSSLYLTCIFMSFPLFSKFSNTQLQKHSQNCHTRLLPPHEVSWACNQAKNNVLFMGSKCNYYLFVSSKKSQHIFHRMCTAASETSPLHKRFNMVLHRISNPLVVQQGQATGNTRPQATLSQGLRLPLQSLRPVLLDLFKGLWEYTRETRAGLSCLCHFNMGPLLWDLDNISTGGK